MISRKNNLTTRSVLPSSAFSKEMLEVGLPVPLSQYSFLLVEDSEADIFLLSEHFEEVGLSAALTVMRDGDEALVYLQNKKKACGLYNEVILLDVHMPRMNGVELLEQIRQDPFLCHLPVIMLTCGELETDYLRSSSLTSGAAKIASTAKTDFYLSKPICLYSLKKILTLIHRC